MSTDYSYNNNAVTDAINSSYQKKGLGAGYQLSPGMTHQVHRTWGLEQPGVNTNKICYVIATWSGKRRAGNDSFHANPIFYLEKHFSQLEKVKHSLGLVILAIPNNPKEPKVFTKYIENLPPTIGGAELKIIRRENIGQSYGSYSNAFDQYPDSDFYIFMEDDYAPIIDYFDDILIQMFKASPSCGYLCSYAHNRPPEGAHAAISNGISSREVLGEIKKILGALPYGGQATKSSGYSADPQLGFSKGFMEAHKRIYDYLSHYNSPFNDAGTFKMYGENRLPTLIYPIQFLQ